MNPVSHSKKSQQKFIVFFSLLVLAGMVILGFYSTHLILTAKPDHFFRNSSRSYHADTVLKIVLPDSSLVWLNRNSDFGIDSAFGVADRKVFLRGEAYFEIKHHAQKPFVLITDHTQTELLAGNINIREFGYSTVLHVVSGVARFSGINNHSQEEVAYGNYADFNKLNSVISQAKYPNENFLAWFTREFHFDNEPLTKICLLLSEVYKIPVYINNKALEEMPISASFENLSKEEIFNSLAQIANCNVEIKSHSVNFKIK